MKNIQKANFKKELVLEAFVFFTLSHMKNPRAGPSRYHFKERADLCSPFIAIHKRRQMNKT